MTDPSMTDAHAVALARRGEVGIITLNRPARINAINDDIRQSLPAALAAFDENPAIRAIAIHGGAGRGFCVGADITEHKPPETPVQVRHRMLGSAWVDAFDRTAKPVIAAIHGFCLGGGLEIALACDIRIAAPCAVFSFPETGLGLIPGAGGTQRLSRIVGLGRALDMLLTGDRINAVEAHRAGLVSRLATSTETLLDEAAAIAERIAGRAPTATLYVKEATRAGADLPLASGMVLERSLFALLTSTADKAEAARAFAEKRPPRFLGE